MFLIFVNFFHAVVRVGGEEGCGKGVKSGSKSGYNGGG